MFHLIKNYRIRKFLKTLRTETRFKFLFKLLNEFPKAEVFLVGGAVRDVVLNRPTNDYDFVVKHVEAGKLEKYLKGFGDVNYVGKSFGVFKFRPRGHSTTNTSPLPSPYQGEGAHEDFDIALPRTEHAWGTGAYKDVSVQSDPYLPIEEDLERRDFTINALALKIPEGTLVDPFGGLSDLRKKEIRTIQDPYERFREDYSRLLRAIRFSCQLGMKIGHKTWMSLKAEMSHINDIDRGTKHRIIPYEIIAKELLKAFVASPVKALDLLDSSGAVKTLMPELMAMKDCPQPKNFHSEGDVWIHTRLALKMIGSHKFIQEFGQVQSSELVVATLFHDIGKPPALKTPEKDGVDRIRFNEHDILGAQMAARICSRLKLSSPSNIGINCEHLNLVIKHHMLFINGPIGRMKNSTIEKYFFNPSFPGALLMQLAFVDALATIPQDGSSTLKNFNAMKKRIKLLKKMGRGQTGLPAPILDGEEIMKALNLDTGPDVGVIKDLLREKQLAGEIKSKEEAKDYLKKQGHKIQDTNMQQISNNQYPNI
jgi:tRNA nucleotidyltransferase/poly(A) polymerase